MNACQALQNREAAVEVESSYSVKDKLVLLTVRDQGCGIPEEIMTEITEPFFTTRRETGGTGMGLFIADSVVNEHKGSIRFTSVVEKGTTVVVALPEEEESK